MKKLVTILVVVLSFASLYAQDLKRSALEKEGNHQAAFTEAVLFDQSLTGNEAGYGYAMQRFTDYNDRVFHSADDFTVPSTVSWTITGITTYCFFGTAGGQLEEIDVHIFADADGLPGEEVYTLEGYVPSDLTAEDLNVTLPEAVVLMPGTYWLCVDGAVNYTNYGRIWWLARTGQNGASFVNEDPTGLTGTAFGWENADYSSAPNDLDLAFQISGATGPVPVELTSFAATLNNNVVNLDWSTATESNNQGFDIERSVDGADFAKIGHVAGNGTTTEVQAYSFTDNVAGISADEIAYRLRQVDYDGTFEYSNVVSVEGFVPTEFNMSQNYPNPFNPSTEISFSLPVEANVALRVYNVIGQEMATITDAAFQAGVHKVSFNASELASGLYIYRLEAKGANGEMFNSVKKMMLMK